MAHRKMSPMHVTLKEGLTRAEFFALLKETSFLYTLGLALAIVRGVAPLSTLDLTRKEKKVCLTF